MPRIAKADVHAALNQAAQHIIDAGGEDGRISRADIKVKTAQLKGPQRMLVDIFFRFIDQRVVGLGATATRSDVEEAVAYAKEKMIDKYDLSTSGLTRFEIREMFMTGRLAVELALQLKTAATFRPLPGGERGPRHSSGPSRRAPRSKSMTTRRQPKEVKPNRPTAPISSIMSVR